MYFNQQIQENKSVFTALRSLQRRTYLLSASLYLGWLIAYTTGFKQLAALAMKAGICETMGVTTAWFPKTAIMLMKAYGHQMVIQSITLVMATLAIFISAESSAPVPDLRERAEDKWPKYKSGPNYPLLCW